jgi:hypothetical protein
MAPYHGGGLSAFWKKWRQHGERRRTTIRQVEPSTGSSAPRASREAPAKRLRREREGRSRIGICLPEYPRSPGEMLGRR